MSRFRNLSRRRRAGLAACAAISAALPATVNSGLAPHSPWYHAAIGFVVGLAVTLLVTGLFSQRCRRSPGV